MAEVDDPNEDLDFLGNGSMKDIAMGMGAIDKLLAEITDMEEKPRESARESNVDGESPEGDDSNQMENYANLLTEAKGLQMADEDSTASIISDTDVYADDYGSGVADLQGELKEFEESQRQAVAEAAAARAEIQRREEAGMNSTVPSTAKNDPVTPAAAIRQVVSVTVVKPTPASVVGISMKSSKGTTRIVSIFESGLLAGTALGPGMELVEINDVAVKSARHARVLIQIAPDKVTIVAREISRVEV